MLLWALRQWHASACWGWHSVAGHFISRCYNLIPYHLGRLKERENQISEEQRKAHERKTALSLESGLFLLFQLLLRFASGTDPFWCFVAGPSLSPVFLCAAAVAKSFKVWGKEETDSAVPPNFKCGPRNNKMFFWKSVKIFTNQCWLSIPFTFSAGKIAGTLHRLVKSHRCRSLL